MIHCQVAYPSWLNIGELSIASALMEVGFIYKEGGRVSGVGCGGLMPRLKQTFLSAIVLIVVTQGSFKINRFSLHPTPHTLHPIYAGLAKEFGINQDFYLTTYHGWDFYSSKNEVVLDAVCKEALYLYPLDVENVSAFSVLSKAKLAIATQVMRQPTLSQLTAFKRLFNAV